MFTLTLQINSTIPLELDGITPEKLQGSTASDVAKLLVQHGNQREELGQFFRVESESKNSGELRIVGETRNVKGIGSGMTDGLLFVEGSAGMHAGAGMLGGQLVIGGNAGDWLGAEMRGGSIVLRGNASHQVGAAYRGSRRGMAGGTIHIHGNAGDELGVLMRRGLIAVGGTCGEFAAADMIAGTIIIKGRPGKRLGAGMKRGTILAFAEPAELPLTFRYCCRYEPAFAALLTKQLALADFRVSPITSLHCYRGDILCGGQGELLVNHIPV